MLDVDLERILGGVGSVLWGGQRGGWYVVACGRLLEFVLRRSEQNCGLIQ